MKTKLKLIALILACCSNVGGQSFEFHFNRESGEVLSTELIWFCVNSDLSVSECKPVVEFVEDEENDFVGNIIWVNENVELIVGTKKELNLNDIKAYLPSNSTLNHGELIEISNKHSLVGRTNEIEDDIYSIYLVDNQTLQQEELVRNCRMMNKINSYFGCGLAPFQIRFIADLNQDGYAEFLLTADKEGAVLRILFGYVDGEYQVLKWAE